ncbi:hypothetical protein NG895_06605 [Aeoliella sp. ICT_H6.2]|uniref:Hydroxylaminobenzene mutase n=1 Tax=Aeoliella straminimaris TaxID=2954799 RepID=A0A9X2JFR7_9BACT|nr:hypothetical protein [Aeoliella straminimaris]MCO6043572.1 hypothetical protein [Aeoliella straminimaris]
MASELDFLQERIRRWTLFLGVLQIFVGCSIGFIPPTAVGWFRGIVMAHIEFTANGVLMVVFGLLVRELALGRVGLWAWFVLLQVGTWTNGTAGVIAGFAGASSPLMPTISEKFPPPNGTQNPFVSASLQVCGVTMMLALALTLYGLARRKTASAERRE